MTIEHNSNFNFDEYKRKVDSDDIKKFEEAFPLRWWEHIPVIGFLCYGFRIQFAFSAIDRGLLRKEVNKSMTLYTLAGFNYPYLLLIFLIPWLLTLPLARAVRKAREKMDNPVLN